MFFRQSTSMREAKLSVNYRVSVKTHHAGSTELFWPDNCCDYRPRIPKTAVVYRSALNLCEFTDVSGMTDRSAEKHVLDGEFELSYYPSNGFSTIAVAHD